jgi:hypothetical protein
VSISSISSNVSQNTVANQYQQLKSDFIDLSKSLSSGDITGAQKAFAALQQDMQGLGGVQSGSQVGNDLAALGNALQSGDLAGAQKAFATLKTDMQSAKSGDPAQGGQQVRRGHHHHHHSVSAQSGTANSADGGSTAQTQGSNIDITI